MTTQQSATLVMSANVCNVFNLREYMSLEVNQLILKILKYFVMSVS